MKLTTTLLTSLALCVSAPLAGAQYFSEGWKPGQAHTKFNPSTAGDPQATGRPVSDAEASMVASGAGAGKGGFVERLLTSGPVSNLLNSAGVNITQKLAEAAEAQAKMWDPRIPMISDANYEELIANETFATPQEEKDRVWFLIVTAQASQEVMSKYADTRFDETYNVTLKENDLPNVRFGRIDYLNVTYLTTKWGVWSAPYLIIAKDRARELRFYRATTLRMDAETMHQFIKGEHYLQHAPWSSSFAPGGSNEYLLDGFAKISTRIYDATILVPRWLMLIITGAIGTFIVQFFHRSDKAKYDEAAKKRAAVVAQQARVAKLAEQTQTATPAATPSPAKKRKVRK